MGTPKTRDTESRGPSVRKQLPAIPGEHCESLLFKIRIACKRSRHFERPNDVSKMRCGRQKMLKRPKYQSELWVDPKCSVQLD